MTVAEGFLVIDKPAGITSHDVVASIRAVTGIKKVGHTGTLDPFATGVLPLALGRATRLIQFLDESVKVYNATISMGSDTDTGDCTGQVIRTAPLPTATVDQVHQVLGTFVGEQTQRPPPFSAVKYKGKPLYYYARKGIPVQVPERPMTIHDMECIDYEPEQLQVRITCSRGTYARVLAGDIAKALRSAGHLSALCRERSGPFLLEHALPMESLAEYVAAEPGHAWQEVLLSNRKTGAKRVPWRSREAVWESLQPRIQGLIQALGHLPLAQVRASHAALVRRGGPIPPAPSGVAVGGRFLVVSNNAVLAVAEHTAHGPKTLRVLG